MADKKATVLIFWATWCAASVDDFQPIQKLVADYKDRGVAFMPSTWVSRRARSAIYG